MDVSLGRRLVIDASVLAKRVLLEPGFEEVDELLDEAAEGFVELHAPALLLKEVGNAIWRHASRGLLKREGAAQLLRAVMNLPLTVHAQDAELLARSLEIALSSSITVYDAIYVALAERLKAELLTYDERLKRAFEAVVKRSASRL